MGITYSKILPHNDIKNLKKTIIINYWLPRGFLTTMMTESPLRNIFWMYLSRFTGFDFFCPLAVFGCSIQISVTCSNTMLKCLSKAFTRPRSFLLFRQLIKTCVLFWTLSFKIRNGPVANSSFSRAANSSGFISLRLFCVAAIVMLQMINDKDGFSGS